MEYDEETRPLLVNDEEISEDRLEQDSYLK